MNQKSLLKSILNKEDLKVYYGGTYFGIYHYTERGYQGKIGYIPKEALLDIVNGKIDYIRFERVDK